MKRRHRAALAGLALAGTLARQAATGAESGAAPAAPAPWQERKSTHYIVEFQGTPAYAADVLRGAEAEYDRIARELGLTRHGDFWLWENRVHIRVYAVREDFVREARAPAWSGGLAQYTRRTILTYEGSDAFLKSILPHEITHLIFREFVGFGSDVPLWLDEGVAQWMDAGNRPKVNAIAQQLQQQQRLASVTALAATRGGRHLSGPEAIAFYAQSATVVGCMLTAHGNGKFREFCGHLRDGSPLDDALRFTYPNTLRNVEALDRAWNAYLEAAPHEQSAGGLYAH